MRKTIVIVLVVFLALSSVSAFAAEYKDKATVKKVQQALNDAGYDCGKPDGAAGKKTKAAITNYQTDKGLTVSGVIDDELLDALGINEEKSVENTGESEAASIDDSGVNLLDSMGNRVTGDFDEPALTHPEERYDILLDKADGPEDVLYIMLDGANDETKDIEENGALYISEHQMVDDNGNAALMVDMTIQNTPYGKAIIMKTQFLWMKYYVYCIGHYGFSYDGTTVESNNDVFSDEAFSDYCESYHFPYGSLKKLRGMRQDENGYTYFFIKSDDSLSFEFVVGAGLRIVQLRVYEEDENGVLKLSQYADYDVGPAWEIPQVVLDEMGKVLEPVKK